MKVLLSILLLLTAPVFAAGPQLLVRGARGADAPLNVAEIAIDITIAGDVAKTNILVGFKNDTHRELEGDFVMPLPEGATVSSYALDVNGRMRPGVAVEKERARFAYESIKRQMIDPGFVEREANNVYRTKIFPIMPKSVKRVQLGYVETLKTVDGKLRYELPCQFDVPVATFSCQIRGTGGTEFELIDDLGLRFENVPRPLTSPRQGPRPPAGDASVEVTDRTINGTLTLNAFPPKLPSLLVEPAGDGEDAYFYLTDRAPADARVPARPTPKSVLLIWDASESRQLHPDELATLDAWFRQIRNTKVRLQILRNKVTEVGVFQVHDGNWKLLRSALKDIYYDGSTALDQLKLDAVPEELVILCSDGISPFGLPAAPPSKPLFILNDSGSLTPRPWVAMAEHSGGNHLDLGRLKPVEAAQRLVNPGLRIIKITGSDIHPYHFNPRVSPGQTVRIAGRLPLGSSRAFQIHYGYGNTVVTTRPFTADSGKTADGGIVRRLWAQAALTTLESVPAPSEKDIIAHCRKFGLVSDFTSLIVLERFEDHVRYEIPPPEPDLLVRYKSAVADKKAKRTARRDLQSLRHHWDRKRDWHRRDFPWMEIALLPRLEQVTIWTRAVSTVFRPEEIDQDAFKTINDWRKAATRTVQKKSNVTNAKELTAWEQEIDTHVVSGSKLRSTPITPPKDGEQLVVSVRGLVNQPGKVIDKAGLTLKQAIAKAGGIFTLGSETNVELYRNAGKTVYNMASNQFRDIPLLPGDMIVVGESNEPYADHGDIDPFAPDAGNQEPWDPSKEPAVVGDSDVWIGGGGGHGGDIDPFAPRARGGAGSPTFLSNITGGNEPDLDLATTITLPRTENESPPAFKEFEAALRQKANPQIAYKALRPPGPQRPEFYVSAARLLARHGHQHLAAQVLSNFLETPELDLRRTLSNAMWLREIGRPDKARTLLNLLRDTMPDEVLPSYHRAMLELAEGRDPNLLDDLLHVITDGRSDQSIIALTDLNGLVAREVVSHPERVPRNLRDNLDADIRIVVLSSDPKYSSNLTVQEPIGATSYRNSPCGGRIDSAAGISEYMMRRAMPGTYTVKCRSGKPTTIHAILYRNWGRPNQTSKTITMLLPGGRQPTTLAEYEFRFEE